MPAVVELGEAIRTTRAMRHLDPDRDVTDGELLKLIEAATMAATGGNSQPVRWLIVRDPGVKRRVGEIYRRQAYVALKVYEERARTDPNAARMLRSAYHLADHLGEAPALIVPCAKGERGQVDASVFPGVQNLMLAARELGLGTTLTTIHKGDEGTFKEVLGIPPGVHTFAIIPVGHPLGRWGEASGRRPAGELVFWDRWGQATAQPA